MKTLGYVGALALLGTFSACAPVIVSGPAAITQPNEVLVTRAKAEEAKLKSFGLTYEPGRREFIGGGKLIPACELVKPLADSIASLGAIGNELAKDEPLYREEALEFSRKVTAQRLSLATIDGLMTPFCQRDLQAITQCLAKDDNLRVAINVQIAGYLDVHPFVRPNARSGFFVFGFHDSKEFRTAHYPRGEELRRSPWDAAKETSSVKEIKATHTCLVRAAGTTELARFIVTNYENTLASLRGDCLKEKAESAKLGRAVHPSTVEFCAE